MSLGDNHRRNRPKTAVIGAEGFIGRHLLIKGREYHPDCVGTSRHRGRAGLLPYDLLERSIDSLRLPETGHVAAVICAAVTSVRACEENPELTRKVNVEGTIRLFHALSDCGVLPVFLSSDSLFDQRKTGPYDEEGSLCPITEYGRQKKEVEDAIRASGKPHLIVRLSKVFGIEKGDGTFLTAAAESLRAGREVLAAEDLIFNPIWVGDAVKAVMALLAGGLQGTVNVCSPETWSRYDLILALANAMGVDPALVKRVPLESLCDFALPKNVTMSCGKLIRETGMSFTPLMTSLRSVAQAYAVATT